MMNQTDAKNVYAKSNENGWASQVTDDFDLGDVLLAAENTSDVTVYRATSYRRMSGLLIVATDAVGNECGAAFVLPSTLGVD
jgi:hypothetical protein